MSGEKEAIGAERRVAALEAENARLRTALAAAGLDASRAAAGATVTPGEAHFRTLADTVPHLVWRSVDGGRWIWGSPNWRSYTGQAKEECCGRGWLGAVHPDDRDVTCQAWEAARTQGWLEVDHRIRCAQDGAWHLHHTRGTLLREGSPSEGEGRQEWVGVSTDIEDVTRLQGEQRNLLLEVQHRTRNLLALVRMMAGKSLAPTPGRDDFGARLAALGRVQAFLARSGAWVVPLRDLVEAELRAIGDSEAGKTEVVGPSVELPGAMVQPIALALHELAANAAKHGAMAHPTGHLAILWWLEGADGTTRLVIEWRETGVAMPQDPAPGRFGRRIIERTVPYQLKGEARLELGIEGVYCRLALPFAGTGTAMA